MNHSILISLLAAVTFSGLSTLFAAEQVESKCKECVELQAIDAKFKLGPQKSEVQYDELQLQASKVIHRMPAKDGSLTSEQIQLYVEILRQSIPHDPARAILDNTFDVLKTNRKAIEAAVKTLPQKEREQITEAIEIVFDSAEHGIGT